MNELAEYRATSLRERPMYVEQVIAAGADAARGCRGGVAEARACLVAVIDPGAMAQAAALAGALAVLLPEFRLLPFDGAAALGHDRVAAESLAAILVHIGRRSVACPEIRREVALLTKSLPNVPLAVIADGESLEEIRQALLIGARGYIPSGMAQGITREVVRLVSAGGTYAPVSFLWRSAGEAAVVPSALPDAVPPARDHQDFTTRQLDILRCLRAGLSNKRIAYELAMCENTVKVHVRNVMKKVGAVNRTQAVTKTWDVTK